MPINHHRVKDYQERQQTIDAGSDELDLNDAKLSKLVQKDIEIKIFDSKDLGDNQLSNDDMLDSFTNEDLPLNIKQRHQQNRSFLSNSTMLPVEILRQIK